MPFYSTPSSFFNSKFQFIFCCSKQQKKHSQMSRNKCGVILNMLCFSFVKLFWIFIYEKKKQNHRKYDIKTTNFVAWKAILLWMYTKLKFSIFHWIWVELNGKLLLKLFNLCSCTVYTTHIRLLLSSSNVPYVPGPVCFPIKCVSVYTTLMAWIEDNSFVCSLKLPWCL